MTTTGYLNPDYAASLAEYGRPLALPRSGGSLLVRATSGSDAEDAIGPYPLFCCSDWSNPAADFESLPDPLVSVVLVTDPFAAIDPPAALAGAFSHGLVRYKEHHIIDLDVPLEVSASAHHRWSVYQGNPARKRDVASTDVEL